MSLYSEVDESWRAILLAFTLTLIVHVGTLLILPDQFFYNYLSDSAESKSEQLYEISLVDTTKRIYVEASPDAPKNKPDRSNNYSYREQQSADQNPLEDAINKPYVVGEVESQKILNGKLRSNEQIEVGVYSTVEQSSTRDDYNSEKRGQTSQKSTLFISRPLNAPNFLDTDDIKDNGEGSRSSLAQITDISMKQVSDNMPIEVYRPVEVIEEVKTFEMSAESDPMLKPKPRIRPRLAPELTTGPLMRSKGSASRHGSVSIDATFSEFGEYEQQFYAAIQSGWYQEIEYFQPIDTATRVLVSFTIHQDGSITGLNATDSTASDIGTFICEEAISKRTPFRAWTKEMIEVFGIKRDLNIVFHYR
jgi:hypothetical protein